MIYVDWIVKKKKKMYKYFKMYVFLMIWTFGGLGHDNTCINWSKLDTETL